VDALLDNVGAAALPIEIHSGEGALLWDTSGRCYWDFYGGHAVTLLGQGHPRWVEALTRQARQLAFFTTLGPVPVRRRAAEALCRFVGLDVAFFVNSGAEANEAALKIARKATGRPVVVAMEHGFHGRTLGALGATWRYREQHAPAVGPTRFVPFGDTEALRDAIGDDVAAVIVEPIQGIAGIVEPPEGFLARVEALCRAHGALLIADEIQCGAGRMGVPSPSLHQGVRPDLLTLGKGLGGGFPVAACLMTRAVADTVRPGEHGTTFGGAPLACAAVEATLAILEEEDLMAKARAIGAVLRDALRDQPGIEEVRGGGAWIGIALDRPAGPVKDALLQEGFLAGTATDPTVLRVAPPAVMPLWVCDAFARTLLALLADEPVQLAPAPVPSLRMAR
jgi:acetylornithine/N-succinyldiaminopimelate aminotransferase